MDSVFNIASFEMQLIYIENHHAQNFPKMNFIRLADVMNNTAIINTFNIDNSFISNINKQHQETMTTVRKRFL